MANMIRILGIDPGLNHTGYGIIDFVPGKHVHVTSGVINTPKGELAERLAYIYTELAKIIETNKPMVSTIEKTFLNTNAQSSMLLSHARGVAMAAVSTHGLQCREFSTREIKKSVTGYGAADKEQVKEMVAFHLQKVKSAFKSDEADALATAICYANTSILAGIVPETLASSGKSGTAVSRRSGSSGRARSQWTKKIGGMLK